MGMMLVGSSPPCGCGTDVAEVAPSRAGGRAYGGSCGNDGRGGRPPPGQRGHLGLRPPPVGVDRHDGPQGGHQVAGGQFHRETEHGQHDGPPAGQAQARPGTAQTVSAQGEARREHQHRAAQQVGQGQHKPARDGTGDQAASAPEQGGQAEGGGADQEPHHRDPPLRCVEDAGAQTRQVVQGIQSERAQPKTAEEVQRTLGVNTEWPEGGQPEAHHQQVDTHQWQGQQTPEGGADVFLHHQPHCQVEPTQGQQHAAEHEHVVAEGLDPAQRLTHEGIAGKGLPSDAVGSARGDGDGGQQGAAQESGETGAVDAHLVGAEGGEPGQQAEHGAIDQAGDGGQGQVAGPTAHCPLPSGECSPAPRTRWPHRRRR